jgi:hypothetical protein
MKNITRCILVGTIVCGSLCAISVRAADTPKKIPGVDYKLNDKSGVNPAVNNTKPPPTPPPKEQNPPPQSTTVGPTSAGKGSAGVKVTVPIDKPKGGATPAK